jgi:hypothetical protein
MVSEPQRDDISIGKEKGKRKLRAEPKEYGHLCVVHSHIGAGSQVGVGMVRKRS